MEFGPAPAALPVFDRRRPPFVGDDVISPL
jgi:hypothetical protein